MIVTNTHTRVLQAVGTTPRLLPASANTPNSIFRALDVMLPGLGHTHLWHR